MTASVVAAFERAGAMTNDESIVVAVSGGVDSMVLLSVAVDILGSGRVVAASFDHQLRDDSEADVELVREFAGRVGCRFAAGAGDVAGVVAADGGSVEAVARRMRYAWLADVARQERARRVLVAHHADDQAETVLFNLLRGGGLAAAGGMDESAPLPGQPEICLMRPLLSIRRADVVGHAAAHDIPFRDDPTNESPDFTRNRIRHEVLPLMREVMTREVVPALTRHAAIVRADEAYLESVAAGELDQLQAPAPVDAVAGSSALGVGGLRRLDFAVRMRVMLCWLVECGVPDVSRRDVLAVDDVVMAAGTPAKVNVKSDLCVRRRAGWLFVASQSSE